jgi:tol-pal system protein YbgF
MRRAGVIRYLIMAASLPLLAACGTFPGLRTSMPPVPAETAPATAAPGQTYADLAQQVKNLQTRVQQLENQVAELEGRRVTPPPAKPRVTTAPPPATYPKAEAKPAVSRAAAEKHYSEGMRLYHEKKYVAARRQLYNYLKNQPKGPKAPEARYYLADSFYKEGKYREAAVEFNKLRLQFPKSILAPAGLLRQALCYKNQKQMSAYRNTLKKLVKSYPHSPEANEGRNLLRESSSAPSRKPVTSAHIKTR